MTDDSNWLKPCPFCGSDAEIITVTGEDGDPHIGAMCVQCVSCGTSSGLIYPLMDDVTGLLYERWNKRSQPPQAERVPMTDVEIQAWWSQDNGLEDLDMCKLDDFTKAIRSVEAHHGIGAKS